MSNLNEIGLVLYTHDTHRKGIYKLFEADNKYIDDNEINIFKELPDEIKNESLRDYIIRISKYEKPSYRIVRERCTSNKILEKKIGIKNYIGIRRTPYKIINLLRYREVYFITSKEFLSINNLKEFDNEYLLISPNCCSYENDRIWFVVTKYTYNKILNKDDFLKYDHKYNRIYNMDIKISNEEAILFCKGLGKVDISKMLSISEKLRNDTCNMIDIRETYNDLHKFNRNTFSLDEAVNVFRSYYEDELSISELSKKYNCTDNIIYNIIRLPVGNFAQYANYIRLKRKRPLSRKELAYVYAYSDICNGMTNEDIMKKYGFMENETIRIRNRTYSAKHIIDYAIDNNMVGKTFYYQRVETNEQTKRAIEYEMSRNLLNAVYGVSINNGSTYVSYEIVVAIIKDYYEKCEDINHIAKKYDLSVNLTTKFVNYHGKLTNRIMNHITLNRKRPLNEKEIKVVKIYGMLKKNKRVNIPDNVKKAILNKYGIFKNIIEYALEHLDEIK